MQTARGAVLEGTIDLSGEFSGTIPETIYLAFAPYASPDGGALISGSQVPACVTCNGNIESNEYVSFQTFRRGDLNADWKITAADAQLLVNVLLGLDTNAFRLRAADVNNDGQLDGRDAQSFLAIMTN